MLHPCFADIGSDLTAAHQGQCVQLPALHNAVTAVTAAELGTCTHAAPTPDPSCAAQGTAVTGNEGPQGHVHLQHHHRCVTGASSVARDSVFQSDGSLAHMVTGGSLATCLGRAKKLLDPVRLTCRSVAEACMQGPFNSLCLTTAVISIHFHHVLEADDCPISAAGGMSCR